MEVDQNQTSSKLELTQTISSILLFVFHQYHIVRNYFILALIDIIYHKILPSSLTNYSFLRTNIHHTPISVKVYLKGCILLTWPNLTDKNILFALYTRTIHQSFRIKGYSKDNQYRWKKCACPEGNSVKDFCSIDTFIIMIVLDVLC